MTEPFRIGLFVSHRWRHGATLNASAVRLAAIVDLSIGSTRGRGASVVSGKRKTATSRLRIDVPEVGVSSIREATSTINRTRLTLPAILVWSTVAALGCRHRSTDNQSESQTDQSLASDARRTPASRLRIAVPEVGSSSVRPVSSTTYVSMSDATGIEVGRILADGVTDQGVLAGAFVGVRTDLLRLFDALEGLAGRPRTSKTITSAPFDEIQVVPTVRQDAPPSRPLFVGDVGLRAKWGLETAFASAREMVPAVSSDDRFHAQAFQLALRPTFNPDSVRPSSYVLVSFGDRDARVRRVENGKVVPATNWYGAANAADVAKAVRDAIGNARPDAWVLVRADASYDVMIRVLDDLAALGLPATTLAKADPADQPSADSDASDLVLGTPVVTDPVPELERRVRTQANKLLWCYLEELKVRPDIGEQAFEAAWVVELDGKASHIVVTGDDRSVADCLAIALRDFQPRKQPNGRSAKVTYPLSFTRRRTVEPRGP